MNPIELLQTLEGKGILLTLSGDRLKVDASAGSLTPELRDAILFNKTSLMELMSQRHSNGITVPALGAEVDHPREVASHVTRQDENLNDRETTDRIAKTRKQLETISMRIVRDLDFLNQLADRSGQDTPEFNRCFAEWEIMLAEEKKLLGELEVAKCNKRRRADDIGAVVATQLAEDRIG